MRSFTIVIIASALTGCAVGNQHPYDSETPQFAVSGTRSVAVATQDSRPYVQSKSKSPTFVGLSRGGFGNPFDVTTGSGKPLAEDFSTTIARSLQQKGLKSTVVSVGDPLSPVDARALVARAGTERLALVSINEWKSDTFMSTALNYDVTLRIYDANGAQLATNRLSGEDNLGADAINPPGHAKAAVPPAYRRKLEELFASQAVIDSLR